MRDCILHLADLHVGAPVTEKLKDLDAATFDAFSRSRDGFLARLADWISLPECRVGLVVIAGDLLHSHQPPEKTADAARRAVAKMVATVPVVTVPGNHDEYSYADCIYRSKQPPWPGELATQTQPHEVWRGELDGCGSNGGAKVAVTAVTYEAGKSRPGAVVKFPDAVLPDATEDHFCLAAVHGTADDHFGSVVVEGERCFTVSHAQVAKAGYRYLALGHIHARGQWTIGRCTAVYPGPPVGPSPSDPGSGTLTLAEPGASGAGVHLVDEHDLIGWRWDVRALDVAPGEEPRHLVQRFNDTLTCEDHRVPVIELSGSVDREGFQTELQQLLLEAGRPVLVETRSVRLAPPPDLPVLLQEESLGGEFARAWQAWCKEEEPDESHAARVLREGFAALGRDC